MKRTLYCKLFAIGIIILFIGISVISSANNVNANIKEEVIDNPEIEPFNINQEIISFISGTCSDYKINHYGIFKRSIETWSDGDITSFKVRGYKYSNNGEIISFGPLRPTHLISQNFIGSIQRVTLQSCNVFGIAIGDIEWS